MVEEISRKRLNYMNAYIIYYDDGSEILRSYGTDVVKRTVEGKYIRLWKSWSRSTSKQVMAYCGHSFRTLPYEDGTYENLKIPYKRPSYKFSGFISDNQYKPYKTMKYEPGIQHYSYDRLLESISNKSIQDMLCYYESGMQPDLNKEYKNNKEIKDLLQIMYYCAIKKRNMNNKLSILCDLSNFDFITIYNKLIDDNLLTGFNKISFE